MLGARFRNQDGWSVPDSFGDHESEISAARQGLSLADVSSRGKLVVEGITSEEIVDVTFGGPTLDVGSGSSVKDIHVYRLRTDLYYVSTFPGEEDATHNLLTEAALRQSELVTITDITHGRAELCMIGSESAELLSRLCGIDFRSASFPNLTARQSSVAKTSQIIVRQDIGDLPAFSVIGARSLGEYLWDTIMKAGQDLNIRPLGHRALADMDAI